MRRINYMRYINYILFGGFKMNQKELKEILSNFSANSGAQLKYYIITSLFPNANKAEIKSIGEFNDQSFSRIERAVRDLGIKPLVAESIVEADNTTKEVKDEATNWETKYNQFADAAAQREMDLLNEIDNLKAANEKAAYDMQGALMKIQYLERELDAANAKIEKLEKVKF